MNLRYYIYRLTAIETLSRSELRIQYWLQRFVLESKEKGMEQNSLQRVFTIFATDLCVICAKVDNEVWTFSKDAEFCLFRVTLMQK